MTVFRTGLRTRGIRIAVGMAPAIRLVRMGMVRMSGGVRVIRMLMEVAKRAVQHPDLNLPRRPPAAVRRMAPATISRMPGREAASPLAILSSAT
jgi:hypothetical protein